MTAARALGSGMIREALGLPGADAEQTFGGVSIDSRSVTPGDLFVALRGERVDGADFLTQVAEAGATGAIVTSGREDHGLPLEYFAVDDTAEALTGLAARVRADSAARVVGVTGSSGKTTVKEMIACALSGSYRVFRTEGNLNSQIGLPLSILRTPVDAEYWVLEIGASEPGEIGRLTALAAPDDVVVTTVGAAHLEAFGDEAGVLDEKLDLVRGASPSGTVVVGELPAMLPTAARELRPDVLVAGLGEAADVQPETPVVGAEAVSFDFEGQRFEVPVGGEHHLRDALMAVAIARAADVPMPAAATGLAGYVPLGHRGAVVRVGDLTVLADCYNANPESFGAAIAQCRDLYPGRRLAAFVGSMLELGDHEAAAHRSVLQQLLDAGFESVAATGLFAGVSEAGPLVQVSEDPEAAWPAFAATLRGDEVVLVKGSRGARLERVLSWLEDRFGAANARLTGGTR